MSQTRTTVSGYFADNYLIANQRLTHHLGPAAPTDLPRERLLKIRAREVVLATGAIERPLVFADNDRPGVMLAGALRRYLNGYGVLPGRRLVIQTNNDSAYALAVDAAAAGVTVTVLSVGFCRICLTTLRHTPAISRSSERTPASRV